MSVYNGLSLTHADGASGVGAVCQSGFFHACQNALDRRISTLIVKVIKIKSVRLSSVLILIDQLIVINAHGRTDALQQRVRLCIRGVRQSAVGILVVRQTADNHPAAAIYVVADNLDKAVLKCAGLRVSGVVAGVFQRRGDHEERHVLQHFRSHFFTRLCDLHLDVVRSSHVDKVGHVSGIISVYIIIVMCAVHQYFCGNGRIGYAQLEHICEGILFPADGGFQFGIDVKSACLVRRVWEGIFIGCPCADHSVLSNRCCVCRVERLCLAFHLVCQRSNCHVVA